MADSPPPAAPEAAPALPKRENVWLSLGCNIALPSILLMKGDEWLRLPPATVLLLALAFPLGYGLYDLATRRKVNLFSVVGLLSTLASGGIGLLNPVPWVVAVKEAAVPLIFGLGALATNLGRSPLAKMLLVNDQLFDLPTLHGALAARGAEAAFERLMRQTTLLLAGAFLLSAILNYGLAVFLVKTDGTVSEEAMKQFNAELGTMLGWSWPVITLPTMAIFLFALYRLFGELPKLAGQPLDSLLRADLRDKAKADGKGRA